MSRYSTGFAAAVFLIGLMACSREQPGSAQSGAGESAETAPRELIFNTYLPPMDRVRAVSVDDFAQRIEAESRGTIDVTVPGASLANSDFQWSLVTEGVADIAIVPVFTHRAQLKLPLLADLPFNCTSSEAASVALWQTQQAYFGSAGEFDEVELLSMYVLPPFQFISNVKPINSLEDFQGLKIWVAAGPQSETTSLLGGVPVFTLYTQLFEYVSKGNIDALFMGPGTVKQAGIADYVRYMTEFPGGLGSMSFAIVMNRESFAALSQAQQDAIRRAAEGLPQRVGQAIDERNSQGLEESGLVVNTAAPALMAEIRDRLAPLEAAWIESARERGIQDPVAVIAYYRSQMESAAAQAPR